MTKDLSEIENWYIGNFRHSNTSVFFLVQSYTKKTPIVVRQNANYHIFLKTPSRKNQSLIYQELGYNTTKERFVEMFNDEKMYDLMGRELTEVPVGVIYIRNNKKYIRVK